MTILAAGTVPWRRTDGGLEVALVHRPKYDDWSWSKGKLDPGEEWPVAAARETFEETGLRVRLGMPLPSNEYEMLDVERRPATKQVRYWAAQVVGGTGTLLNEIDMVDWLDVAKAHDRLDYDHDRNQLHAVLRADLAGTLATWPLLIVRHALALPRSAWKRADGRRPLVPDGHARATVLTGVLDAYGVTRIVTSPSKRCVQTIRPYAVSARVKPVLKASLSEEGFKRLGAGPTLRVLERALRKGRPTALCTHGPVLPTLLKAVRARVSPDAEGAATAYPLLEAALDDNLDKGEALVAHLAGTGKHARVVAVERHRL